MPAHEIEFASSAEKAFRKLPQAVRRRFSAASEHLQQNPWRRRPGCDVRLLSGAANAWRLRVGDYRGIHAIEEPKIVFTRFGHRKDTYRS